MQTTRFLALALLLGACGSSDRYSAPMTDRYASDWVVDPRVPGPDLPPVGRSLFDTILNGSVPFPFTRLLEQIEARLGGRVRYRRVLIPLGRSLQRNAAAPGFFRYPRAVVAFDAEPSGACAFPAKDRLFMGYQEKAGVIEVLSYNEMAGRFEFQVVEDYREGAIPRVKYARRAGCTVCHQNQAPLFPRQLWDETNSNSRVSRLLLRERRSFYGFPTEQSADEPYQIDNAVHRANEFSTYQLLWTGADVPTRAAWLRAMLVCRLSAQCELNPADFTGFMATWRAKWPRGLRIPNPEIANRNPLAILTRDSPRTDDEIMALLAARQKSIETQFEPAVPRDPLEIWRAEPNHIQRVIAGLGTLFPESDINEIERALRGKYVELAQYHTTCTAGTVKRRVELRCGPANFSMDGLLYIQSRTVTGFIRKLSVRGQPPVRDLVITGGRVSIARDGLHGTLILAGDGSRGTARCCDGNRIERIELKGREAALLVRRDFQILESAIGQLAVETQAGKTDILASKPFQPFIIYEALYNRLGFTVRFNCVDSPAIKAEHGRKSQARLELFHGDSNDR